MLEILENYWSQILLFITSIGIVLRMIFSFVLKKKEINHSIFHKNRMDALIRFYNTYSELKSMWNKLPIYQILKNELSSDEIDNRIQPPLNKLEASIIELQVYFKQELYSKFKEIENNMMKMNSQFLKVAFDINTEKTLTDKSNDYNFFRMDIEKKNTEILSEINNKIAKKY